MKRTLFHQVVSALLALLVLVASVGMTVRQTTCLVSGRRTASVVFTPPRHQCPQSAAKAAALANPAQPAAAACCDFSTHQHKLNAFTPELTWEKLLSTPLLAPQWLSFAWSALRAGLLLAPTHTRRVADHSPPLRAGRALLTFIGVLII